MSCSESRPRDAAPSRIGYEHGVIGQSWPSVRGTPSVSQCRRYRASLALRSPGHPRIATAVAAARLEAFDLQAIVLTLVFQKGAVVGDGDISERGGVTIIRPTTVEHDFDGDEG